MKLVVGLGNPGGRYAATRHNVGFRVAERFAERRGIELDEQRFEGRFGRGHPLARMPEIEVGVLVPETFMNRSGDAVVLALAGLPVGPIPDDLLVVVDDVDLRVGRLRIRPGGGAGGQKGLAHIIERLGRDDFPRLRFGVGRPPEGVDTADHVLRPFDADDRPLVEAQISHAADAVETILADGIESAMNRYNPDPEAVTLDPP